MTTTTRAPAPRAPVPADRPVLALPPQITAALAELHIERTTVPVPATADRAAWASASVRRMFIAARLSAWWELLARWIAAESDLPVLLARAATAASLWELDEAERARDDLTHWRGRCARPAGAAESGRAGR